MRIIFKFLSSPEINKQLHMARRVSGLTMQKQTLSFDLFVAIGQEVATPITDFRFPSDSTEFLFDLMIYQRKVGI